MLYSFTNYLIVLKIMIIIIINNIRRIERILQKLPFTGIDTDEMATDTELKHLFNLFN